MLGFGFDLVGFRLATRYTRSPSAFFDVSVKPSFLRTTPAKKPRTECCCHPVAFMIATVVVLCVPKIRFGIDGGERRDKLAT